MIKESMFCNFIPFCRFQYFVKAPLHCDCIFHRLASSSPAAGAPEASRWKWLTFRKTQMAMTAYFDVMQQKVITSSSLVVQQHKVVVPNKYGEKLVGLLHDTGSPDIVVLCHGFQSTKENEITANLAAALETKGISVFRFDFAGNGESEGSFQYGNYGKEADDLQSVIRHFREAGRVISIVLGHSKGGDVVLLYASKYHDVRTVVNISGRYDLKKGISERLGEDYMQRVEKEGFIDITNKKGGVIYRVTAESLMERLNTNMHEACLQIDKECRVLTVHGSGDEIIPVEDAYEFAKIISNHKLQIVEGADHGYTSHQPELSSIVVDFITAALQENKDAQK